MTKAVILAAGRGLRLNHISKQIPKCLLIINHTTILENCLDNLLNAGVNKTVIVVGHLKEQIIDKIGDSYKGMPIKYIVAENYETTNNIVSLCCASEELTEDLFLIESDVFFGSTLLPKIIGDTNVAVVSQWLPGMKGTIVKDDNLYLDIPGDATCKKTVNIYYLKKELMPSLVTGLKSYSKHNPQLYYEVVLVNLIFENIFIFHETNDWAEVDDIEDLKKAQYKFSSIDEKYEIVSNLHGYFPEELVDHCHLYNMYFPPKDLLEEFQYNIKKLVNTYPSGHNELAYYLSEWLNLDPSYLAIGNGASEIIKILSQDNKFCVSTPSFNEFENDNTIKIPLDSYNWQFDTKTFTEVLNSTLSIGVIITPNNPTSIKVTMEDVLYVLQNTNRLVLVDESFGNFCNQSFISLIEEYPNLVVMKSMGKAFGICGLRLGYIASKNPIIQEVKRRLPIWNINNFAETFLRKINRYEKSFRQSCGRTCADRDELYLKLSQNKKIKVWKPDGNFLFCKTLNGEDLVKHLFMQNILVKSCKGKTMESGNQYIRIGCRTQIENEKLCSAISQYYVTLS